MQYIDITTTMVRSSLDISYSRLDVKHSFKPEYQTERRPSELSIKSEDIKVKLDTSAIQSELNLKNNTDLALTAANNGRQAVYEAIGAAVRKGNEMAKIAQHVTIADIVRQENIHQPESYTVFIPSNKVNISWEPGSLSMKYDPGDLKLNWDIKENEIKYVPGHVKLGIEQYPRVDIEYHPEGVRLDVMA